ncbi:response regulator receiver domain-containing protein [Saccharothrix saharensis]|uniref:Response regulator receiver domain-containing protein n=1 Tax=Saccharothrix saharensis TaxID=571190 RepID=A0A543JRQ4_9PSEU|nr:response regulator transcription factor [Saccharothrix saharensis]TQM85519.1 response regulator receiver domain-containing protein [Saccharothrix saharensis]
MTDAKLRVVISDDDPMIRDALREVLDAEPDFEVVAVARDADEAIELVERHSPAVVVLDVRMPGGGGGRAAREIRLRWPNTGILALSAFTDRETFREFQSAGVGEHLVKGASNSDIVAAVRRLGRPGRG